MRSAVYTGTLMHARRGAQRNVFRYPLSTWLFDLDELPELERRLRLFSYNSRNVVSLRDGDHFDGVLPLKRAVREFVGEPDIERVLVLTQPRVLGYVFNPVSFYWCYRADGSLACMVSELNNTFGERLPEVLRGPDLRYEHRKRLHVSPFFGLDSSYEYAFSQPGRRGLGADPRARRRRLPAADGGAARPAERADERDARPAARALPGAAAAGDRADPLAGAASSSLKRVPFHHKPDVRAGRGVGPMSVGERTLRQEPRARGRLLERAALAILERALARPRGRHARGRAAGRHAGGASERARRSSCRCTTCAPDPPPRDARQARLRRVVPGGRMGRRTTSPALFELLLRNAERGSRRHPRLAAVLRRAAPARTRATAGSRARRNIAYHYDLGNDLFELMLDETMTYSCAVFESPDDSLADAQRRKYRRICEHLRLEPSDRVLEIGCGWGGFARFAASEYGCHVTGLTISAAQAELARERTAGLDVRILEQDYREHQGSYTKVASIEMLEAIGERQFGTYFATIDRLLEPERRRLRPDDPRPGRPLGALPQDRPTGSSATSSRAA